MVNSTREQLYLCLSFSCKYYNKLCITGMLKEQYLESHDTRILCSYSRKTSNDRMFRSIDLYQLVTRAKIQYKKVNTYPLFPVHAQYCQCFNGGRLIQSVYCLSEGCRHNPFLKMSHFILSARNMLKLPLYVCHLKHTKT